MKYLALAGALLGILLTLAIGYTVCLSNPSHTARQLAEAMATIERHTKLMHEASALLDERRLIMDAQRQTIKTLEALCVGRQRWQYTLHEDSP